MKRSGFIVLILSAFLASKAVAQPGARDSSFGINGVVSTFMENGCQSYNAVEQSDGKILVVGTVDSPGPLNYAWGIARYNSDGSLDTAFSDNGTNYTQLGLINVGEAATAVAVGSNGKIAVVGYAGSSYAIALFNSDGNLDAGFGNNGVVFIDTIQLSDVAVQDDGKILVAGSSDIINHYLFSISRYNPNGTLDTSFGEAGVVTNSLGNFECFIWSIEILPQGKILAGGGIIKDDGDRDFAIVRYNNDGTLDSSFNEIGFNVLPFDSYDDVISSIKQQPDGKIIVVGSSFNDQDIGSFVLSRYTNEGTIDSIFGTNGIVYTQIGSLSDVPYSVELQSDGKIIVGGSSKAGENYLFALARYNSNGHVDSAFSNDGLLTDSFNPVQYQIAMAIIIQSDDKIVAIGSSSAFFTLVRYLSTWNVGIIDLSISTNSVLIYPNPITESATLKYTLPTPETISIHLLDVQGKLLKTFIENEKQDASEHQQEISFPDPLPSGVYFLKISGANGGNVSVKVIK